MQKIVFKEIKPHLFAEINLEINCIPQRGILEQTDARRIQPDRSSPGGESGRMGGQIGNRTENRWHKIADGGD